jgi:hypothetical protein
VDLLAFVKAIFFRDFTTTKNTNFLLIFQKCRKNIKINKLGSIAA